MRRIILIVCFVLILLSFSAWITEYVDILGNVGTHTSIALDSYDHPYISYKNEGNDSLKCAIYDGSNWDIFTVDYASPLNRGEYSSIALDSYDHPHISYYSQTDFDLRYATFDGSIWQVSAIDTIGAVGTYTSIVIDSFDNPHIAYGETSNSHLKYAKHVSGTWIIETVGTQTYVHYTSLDLDNSNFPHIAYNSDGPLRYAFYDGTTWQFQTSIDPMTVSASYISMALDSNDLPHISYYNGSFEHLNYAHYDGTTWHAEEVDYNDGCGRYSSIAVDSSNNPHISYYDYWNQTLKYAYFNGFEWIISVVDDYGDVGGYTSIAIDSYDRPHISYYDNLEGNLKYTYNDDYTGVSLLSFAAQPQPNSAIKLVWQVSASDSTQIVGFNLYRADIGKARKKDWTRLNSSPITGDNPYQYVDAAVQAGQDYQYRLFTLTADGKEEMLGTTQGEAGTTPAQFALTAVYPNPTRTLLTCRLTMPQAGSVSLGLYDISGRLVLSQRMDLSGGEQETALEVGNLARGIYTVRASSGGESATKRIVVMR